MKKINEKKLRKLIRESMEEMLNPIAYPGIAQPDFEDSVPIVKPNNRVMATNDINEKLRRTIFNIMSDFEGQHKEYSIGSIAKDVAERYKVSYEKAYKVAEKCLKSRKAKGEADFCVPDGEAAAGGYREIAEGECCKEFTCKPKKGESKYAKKMDAIDKIVAESVKKILEGRGKPAWKKNAFSPSATLRQDARDKYMSRYLSGADREPEESPSEIYTKDWKLRDDGNLVSGGKRSDRNYVINKSGNYLGNQEYEWHNPSEDDWYGNSSPWREPTYRKTIGKVTPDDIDTLKRVNKEKLIPENNMAKLNEKQLRKVVAECVKRALKEGMTADNPNFGKWNEAKEVLGAETMLDAIFQYLDVSKLEQILGWLNQDYDLWNDEEETENNI